MNARAKGAPRLRCEGMRRRVAPDPELLELFERAGANAERGTALLRDTLAAVPDAAEVVREVYLCEQEGDRMTHAILRRLAEQGRRTHLDAADVHALAVALDDVVDFAEEAADQLGRYAVEAPMEQAEAIAELLVAAAHEVTAALHELRNGMDLGPHIVDARGRRRACASTLRARYGRMGRPPHSSRSPRLGLKARHYPAPDDHPAPVCAARSRRCGCGG